MANEKQVLIEVLKKYHDARFTPGVYEHSIFGKAALLLEKSVEVVRCKDCKHYHEDTFSCDFTPHGKYYERPNWYEEDFCSYGERRSE